jgi:DNA-binding NtrC family response regulator
VLDGEPPLADAVRQHFQARGHEVIVARDADDALGAHRRAPADVVLIDLALGPTTGLTVLRELQRDPAPPECLITGQGSIALAVDAIHAGASDYVAKPFRLADLDAIVTHAGALRAHRVSTRAAPPAPLDEVERRHIARVLDREDWHQGRAATALGISPKTLYRKIRQYGFHRPPRARP